MPSTRHRARHPTSRARFVSGVVVVLLLLSGVSLAATLALRDVDHVGACAGSLVVTVVVGDAVEAPVRRAAEAYQPSAPAVGGRCVEFAVTSRGSAEAAGMLAAGWTDPAAGAVPDVWLPDSTMWLDAARNGTAGRRLLPETVVGVASSPVVVAMPRSMAQALGWPDRRPSWQDIHSFEAEPAFWGNRGKPDWGPFRLAMADPNSSAASMSAMLSVVAAVAGEPVTQLTPDLFSENLFVKKAVLDYERNSGLVVATEADLLGGLRAADATGRASAYMSAAPMTENAVYSYNNGLADGSGKPPNEPLVAVQAADGTPVEQVPFVVLSATRADPARASAAQGLLEALQDGTGQAAFERAGFRASDGTNDFLTQQAGFVPSLRVEPAGAVGPGVAVSAGETFRAIHQRGTTLAVVDTSGSMSEVVPDSGGKTRMQIVVEACDAALPMFADDSRLGLWNFATRVGNGRDYTELVPIGPLDQPFDGMPRAQAMSQAQHRVLPRGDTGLYDTALAAFRELTRAYTPGGPNQVVLMTDGRNDDPNSVSLGELLSTLHAEFDAQRPVHIITIAYGGHADTDALRQISEATRGRTYPALYADSIFQVLVDALTSS